jgi:O-acetyl-ADP-ribose deacetylase (regulator of RNase III)
MIKVIKNNILTTITDIMVLSANPSLLAGSGISWAIQANPPTRDFLSLHSSQ